MSATAVASIHHIVREVVDANPRIQAQREVVEQLRARVSAAKSRYLPSIEGNALIERRRLTVVDGDGDQSFTLGLGTVEARQPLFDGGRTAAAVQIARGELANAEAVLDSLVNEVVLELLTAAADARQAAAVKGYATEQQAAIASQLEGTRRRVEVRDATLTDIAWTESRLAAADAVVLDAQNELSSSEARWKAVSGRPFEGMPDLPELPFGPPTLDDAVTRAAQDAPKVRAAQTAADAGRGSVAAAKAELAPSVEAVAGYQYVTGGVANLFTGRLPNDRTATFGGVAARIPLFQRGAEYAEIRRAKALRDQREFQVAQTVREVVREVEIAWAHRRASVAIAATARNAVVAAETAATGVTREVQLGARTTLDMLDVQRDLLAAQIVETRAKRTEYVARAALIGALGQLPSVLLTDPR